jgi:hypothetical protein
MTHVFGSPVNAQRALQNNVTFNFGVYDAPRALQEAWQWSTNHAVEAVLLSIEHVFDLFVGSIPWPSSATRFNGLANLYQQIYLVFILLPACIYLWGHARPMMRMDQSSVGSALLLLPLLGLMIAAFLTIGEPRYRIPYDGFTIIFAACAYVNRYVEPQSIVVQGEGRDGR